MQQKRLAYRLRKRKSSNRWPETKHFGKKDHAHILRTENSGLALLKTLWPFLTICSEGEEPPHFHPEFGRFMLEATPGRPWGIDFKDLLKVESNMRWRY